MKKKLLAALAVWMTADAPLVAAEEKENIILLRQVQIVSAEETSPSAAIDVLVKNGRIERIEAEQIVPEGALVVDGSGKFLSPGLIDSHTHLGQIPGMRGDQAHANPDVMNAAIEQMPRSYLYYGFTNLIDLHANKSRIDAWNELEVGPTTYFCGAAPFMGGYPMVFSEAPQRYRWNPYFLYDLEFADSFREPFPEGYDMAAHTPAGVAARMKADGAVCLKTHYEHGFGHRRDLPTPPVPLIQKLVTEAHKVGLPVLLHANSEVAQRFGVDAGVDAFVHGMWRWEDETSADMPASVKAIVDAAVAAGTALQPTIQVLYGETDLLSDDYLNDDELKDTVPAPLLAWYQSEEGQWFRRTLEEVPFLNNLKAKQGRNIVNTEGVARVTTTFQRWAEAGGELLFGSDTPSDATYANPHGLNGAVERRHWKAAGISPARFFYAATLGNARFFGLDGEIGTVAEGKRADLLLLNANPLLDSDAFDNIDAVIVHGQFHKREDLSARHTYTDSPTKQ